MDAQTENIYSIFRDKLLLLGEHVLSGEPAVSIVSSCGSILAPRKDDGTDFGCFWIQSNGH
jgi:hypothetical protein